MHSIKVTEFGTIPIGIDGIIVYIVPDNTDMFKPHTVVEVSDQLYAKLRTFAKRKLRQLVDLAPLNKFVMDFSDINGMSTYDWTEDTAWECIRQEVYDIHEQYDKNDLINMFISSAFKDDHEKLNWIKDGIKDEVIENPKVISAVKFLEEL